MHFIAQQDGDLNDIATWGGCSSPGILDSIETRFNHTMRSAFSCDQMNFAGGCLDTFEDAPLTVAHDVNLDPGSYITVRSGSGPIQIGGSVNAQSDGTVSSGIRASDGGQLTLRMFIPA